MTQVTVIQIPGTIQTVALADDTSVKAAMEAANIDTSVGLQGYTIKADGVAVELAATLTNGTTLIISKGAKGAKRAAGK